MTDEKSNLPEAEQQVLESLHQCQKMLSEAFDVLEKGTDLEFDLKFRRRYLNLCVQVGELVQRSANLRSDIQKKLKV